MPQTPQDFAFIDAGRTFTCRVEAARAARANAAPSAPVDAWWWFDVSTERHQRHAPFRAAAGDTPVDVAVRIVAYYDDLLARRAAPPVTRWQRKPDAAAGAPAAAVPGAAAPGAEPAP